MTSLPLEGAVPIVAFHNNISGESSRVTTLFSDLKMAKAKHGNSGGPTGKQKSKKMAENTHFGIASSEEDDDEAPEEVTFEDSKAAALRSMREAIDTARRCLQYYDMSWLASHELHL